MEELLSEIPKEMQDKMVFKGGRKIDDFKIRGPIFQEYPTTVKIGTKEGIFYDERFYAYEISKDEKTGKEKKSRVGVLRVSKIANNDTIAIGKSPASTFCQQGGKTLYSGTLVELKEDFGVGLNIGMGLLNNPLGGFNIGAEVRIPSFILKQRNSWGKYLRGIHLTANLTLKSFSEQNFFKDDLIQTAAFNGKSKGNAASFIVAIARETYLTKKGNFYIMPELGGGVTSLNITGKSDTISGSSTLINAALSLGFHITPNISVYTKTGVYSKLGYTWKEDETEVTELVNSFDKSSDWGFDKLEGIAAPIYVGLRIRL